MIIKRFEATESSSGGGIPVVPIAIALVLANVVIWGALVDGGSYFENGTWDLFDQNWSRNDQYGSTDKKNYSKVLKWESLSKNWGAIWCIKQKRNRDYNNSFSSDDEVRGGIGSAVEAMITLKVRGAKPQITKGLVQL